MMTLTTFAHKLKKGWKTVLFFTLGFFVFSLIYIIFLFKPIYMSKSKLLIEEVSPMTFVADLGKGRNLETNSQEKNPILTQIEVLTSEDLAAQVYQALIRENIIQNLEAGSSQKMIHGIHQSLQLKTPPATDVIEVNVTWNNPALSFWINRLYLEEFRKQNINLNRASVTQAKKYIQEQLKQSTKELQAIRKQIRDFKKSHGVVELNSEASTLVKDIADNRNALSSLDSQIRYHRAKAGEYGSKLQVNPRHLQGVLNAVALGQNSNLANLNKVLSEVEQQYAALSVRYPRQTKKMSALQQNINQIKVQIQNQIAATVGSGENPDEGARIQDSVRTQMVNDLISNSTETLSLSAKRSAMQNQLSQLKAHQLKLPDVQATLSQLVDREVSLVSIIAALTSKLVEASVRESGIISNINVIQKPAYPEGAAFPSVWQIIMGLGVLGASVGCLSVLGRDYLLDRVNDDAETEALLQMPNFGKLGWIPESHYHVWSQMGFSYSDATALEYERIVTALKIKQEDTGKNVFGLTCLSDHPSQSGIICETARLLSRCNYSVLLIDADFRHCTVARSLHLDPNQLPDYKDFLACDNYWKASPFKVRTIAGERMTLTEDPEQPEEAGEESQNAYVSQIDQYIVPLKNENSLYVMSHREPCKNPYELVNSKFFPLLIEYVKERFDFVLVDMPPILANSDASLIARFLDGIVPICGLNSSRERLRTVRKLCDTYSLPAVGVIVKSES